jgi:hypothetical protein
MSVSESEAGLSQVYSPMSAPKSTVWPVEFWYSVTARGPGRDTSAARRAARCPCSRPARTPSTGCRAWSPRPRRSTSRRSVASNRLRASQITPPGHRLSGCGHQQSSLSHVCHLRQRRPTAAGGLRNHAVFGPTGRGRARQTLVRRYHSALTNCGAAPELETSLTSLDDPLTAARSSVQRSRRGRRSMRRPARHNSAT